MARQLRMPLAESASIPLLVAPPLAATVRSCGGMRASKPSVRTCRGTDVSSCRIHVSAQCDTHTCHIWLLRRSLSA
eukprot:1510006-Prymnesium_polylepis.1